MQEKKNSKSQEWFLTSWLNSKVKKLASILCKSSHVDTDFHTCILFHKIIYIYICIYIYTHKDIYYMCVYFFPQILFLYFHLLQLQKPGTEIPPGFCQCRTLPPNRFSLTCWLNDSSWITFIRNLNVSFLHPPSNHYSGINAFINHLAQFPPALFSLVLKHLHWNRLHLTQC